MLFNSISFLIFFPIVTALYFILPYRMRWALLLVASCIFYAFYIPVYLLILGLTIVVDYIAGIYIGDAKDDKHRKWFLGVSIFANLGVLFYFKYYNFASDSLHALAAAIDWHYPIRHLGMLLPIGLSFHTFQSMSYTIEVYRRKQEPERHLGIFALYVMFYPQLLAGPIERPQSMLHQFYEKHDFQYDHMVSGLKLMAWGMFKKVVIADRLAIYVDQVYRDPHHNNGLALAIATAFCTMQVYCDFSGYSDIARGASRVMGFRLMRNFRTPYFARSIGEFWTRWHISLSSWFKDYVYITLGGNRCSKARRYFNLMVTFMVSGLWHGASWTFVVWGAMHGAFLVLSLIFTPLRERVEAALHADRMPKLVHLVQVLWMFYLVTIARIFFRAPNIATGLYILKTMTFSFHVNMTSFAAAVIPFTQDSTAVGQFLVAIGLIGFLFVAEAYGQSWLEMVRNHDRYKFAQPFAWGALCVTMLLFGEFGGNTFVYFKF